MKRVRAFMPFRVESGNHYVYDDITGMVFPSSAALLALLEAHAQMPLDLAVQQLRPFHDARALLDASRFIDRWQRNHSAFYRSESDRYLYASRLKLLSSAELRKALDEVGFRQITLTLTEDCNLRCRYCCFSPTYSLTRNRTHASMTRATGRKALSRFFAEVGRQVATTKPCRDAVVGFYGGEPLLAQQLIRDFVGYADTIAPCPVTYTITTNGTLLRGDIADFLVEHGFDILVSVDGHKANHDRSRVYPDGSGSWHTTLKNLGLFRSRYPGYDRISLICVVDLATDLRALDDFFEAAGPTLPPLSRLTFVSPRNTTYYDSFTDADRERSAAEQRACEARYLAAKRHNGPVSPVQAKLCEPRYRSMAARSRHGNSRIPFLPFTACCIPGTRLNVRVDGQFDICERVTARWPIGDVDRGLDVEAVIAVIRTYFENVCDRCGSCPVTRLCGLCFAACEGTAGFEQSEADCERMRNGAKQILGNMYSVLEVCPGAFSTGAPEETVEFTEPTSSTL